MASVDRTRSAHQAQLRAASRVPTLRPLAHMGPDESKSQVSRSFSIFKAFSKGLLQVVCRKGVNGDIGRALRPSSKPTRWWASCG
ncbi:hypothetical protein DUNSADRAFT_3420 [Dunaliella salina]|uniref:Encoded protein n=1 Tax=Dunaliella salina TaxID=3046 RepID=A0ABQ7FVT2_DUNSA|nr:hypothetical protein DUNSADRAFT_3420 [Dunaliella salina]|eukprot:KAF5826361.1 hypothetical protein DUNSADRAFT_3420 [Dunaliella salina]